MDVVVGEDGAELLLEQQQVLGAGTHDGMYLVTACHQLACHGEGDGQAHSTADDGPGAVAHLGGLAQRSGHVLQAVTGLVG